MAKITSIKSRYSDGEKQNSNIFASLWNWFVSLDKFYRLSIVSMLLILIATPIITAQNFNFTFLEHAATNKTAIISVAPYSGTYPVGQTFTVNLIVDGGGQTFNAAKADISLSSNLAIQTLTVTPQASGGCNFTFVNNQHTPTAASPSFAGAILNGSSPSCIVYSLTVLVKASGVASITINNGSVKSYSNSNEILNSVQSGTYNTGVTPTPTPTALPTATPTPIATPTPSAAPSLTPTPTASPVQPPAIDPQPSDTYQSTIILTGTKTTDVTTIFVNNSSVGVTYPTSTTWQYPTTIVLGGNTFTIYGQNATGVNSNPTAITLTLHRIGDISGDGVIDLTDLSMFGTDYENPGTLNYALSDMNGDGIVDLTDFSIIAKAYGN